MSQRTEVIYIPLLDEGVNVWRPTQAEPLGDGTYRVLPTPNYDPDDEQWEFPPGSKVVCEWRRLSTGHESENVLTAVRSAGQQRQRG